MKADRHNKVETQLQTLSTKPYGALEKEREEQRARATRAGTEEQLTRAAPSTATRAATYESESQSSNAEH